MKSNQKAHLAVLTTNFLFGINYATIKFLTPSHILPFALNMARVLTALILFWLLYFLKPSKAGIRKQDIPRFIVCAATGVVVNQLLFVKGLSLTTTIHASLLALATPIFITFIAAWLLKEMLTLQKIAGLILGVSGAALLILIKDNSHTGTDILLGDSFVLINAISYAFYMVLVRPLMKIYTPVHVVRWVFTFGFIMLVPFAGPQFLHTDWASFNLSHFMALGLVCIGATFVTYLFNVYGISVIGASATGSYIYTQPVFAAILAIFLMGEHLTVYKIISAALIFLGVYLVNLKKLTE
jgi:drug/metabolite transporter (DMT)-like permease